MALNEKFGITNKRATEIYSTLVANLILNCSCESCGLHADSDKAIDYINLNSEEILGAEDFIMPSELSYLFFQLGRLIERPSAMMDYYLTIDQSLGFDHIYQQVLERITHTD